MSKKFESALNIGAEYIDVYYVEHLFFSCTAEDIDFGWLFKAAIHKLSWLSAKYKTLN